jgi:hypothetical protein
MGDLLFAVWGPIEIGEFGSNHIFHSVEQHAVEEPGEFAGHRLRRHPRPRPSPKSAELRS